MSVYKRGGVYWMRFVWDGETTRESCRTSNKRLAGQIEAARKTALAKGEVGIRDRVPAPTFATFAESDFLPHVRSRFAEKPSTLTYYEIQVKHLTAYAPLSRAKLDAIGPEIVTGFIEKQRAAEYEVSSINRALQVLRRMLRLAAEWGTVQSAPPRLALLPGERRRERVLTLAEEQAYLNAARTLAENMEAAYQKALTGIRAVQRGEVPKKPEDPYLLHDVALVLLDCGLRPEECYRLRWEHIRDGALHVPFGKTANARRSVPMTARVSATIEMRHGARTSDWVFPAPTKSGHIEQSTLKRQHAAALNESGVTSFVLYSARHTCLTRWSRHLDPYTLAYFAGHSDFSTTRRYVHPNLDDARAAMERARNAQGGHNMWHSADSGSEEENPGTSVIN